MDKHVSRRPGPKPRIAPPWINHRLVKHTCGLYFYEAHWNGGPHNGQSIYYLQDGEVAQLCPSCGQSLAHYVPLYQLHRNCDHKECRDWQGNVPEPPGGGIETIVDYRKPFPNMEA